MRNKIQEEEKTIEKSSVDEDTMKNGDDWPDRGDERVTDGLRIIKKRAMMSRTKDLR